MNSELIEYYTNLLIAQYHTKEKARAVISLLISIIMIYDLAISIRDGFEINSSVGKQLDIIGKFIGPDRVITGVDYTNQYFGYRLYGSTTPWIFSGYRKYGDAHTDVKFLQYGSRGKSVYTLTDSEYRDFLKYKIGKNSNQPSLETIDTLLNNLIGGDGFCTDNFNMSLTYTFVSSRQRWATILNNEDMLPRPAGVNILLAYI